MRIGTNPGRWTTLIACLAIGAMTLSAQQVSGSISGVVKDNQGAVIPNAKVTLVDTKQGDQREGRTNAEGIFLFTPLKPSTYSVAVEFSGFKKLEQKSVTVFANDRIDLGVMTLEVGGVTESIVVEASAVQAY
jgi:hypothetical protein